MSSKLGQNKRSASMESSSSSKPKMHRQLDWPEQSKEDADKFLKKVKSRFQNERNRYREFLVLFSDYRHKRFTLHELIMHLKNVLGDNHDLIYYLNSFLPEELRIPNAKFTRAIEFLQKVKARFMDDETRYMKFLEVLNSEPSQNKSIPEIYREVVVMLEDHQDLLDELVTFTKPAEYWS